jgi:hypothetical protein
VTRLSERSILPATVLVFVIAMTGCVWPHYGEGGADEVYNYSRLDRLDPVLKHAGSNEFQIAQKIDRLRKDIDLAWRSEGAKYRPANLTLIEMQWGRASRVFSGGMIADAKVDIDKLENMLRSLRVDIDDIEMKKNENDVDDR